MLKTIKLNLEAIEVMNYFWQAASEKENVSEQFFHDVGQMTAMTCIYNDEFDAESVRRVLSAIKNREPLTGNQRERKFWNLNMWIMEDMEYKNAMITPVKQLNLDDLISKVNEVAKDCKYESIEVVFSPMFQEEYLIKDAKLLINFFMVRPSDIGESFNIKDREVKEFIQEKIIELLSK